MVEAVGYDYYDEFQIDAAEIIVGFAFGRDDLIGCDAAVVVDEAVLPFQKISD